MARKTYHVVPAADGGWIVRRGGAERASKHYEKQGEAIDWARSASKSAKGELFIHRKDGSVRAMDSYGPELDPARDKR